MDLLPTFLAFGTVKALVPLTALWCANPHSPQGFGVTPAHSPVTEHHPSRCAPSSLLLGTRRHPVEMHLAFSAALQACGGSAPLISWRFCLEGFFTLFMLLSSLAHHRPNTATSLFTYLRFITTLLYQHCPACERAASLFYFYKPF